MEEPGGTGPSIQLPQVGNRRGSGGSVGELEGDGAGVAAHVVLEVRARSCVEPAHSQVGGDRVCQDALHGVVDLPRVRNIAHGTGRNDEGFAGLCHRAAEQLERAVDDRVAMSVASAEVAQHVSALTGGQDLDVIRTDRRYVPVDATWILDTHVVTPCIRVRGGIAQNLGVFSASAADVARLK